MKEKMILITGATSGLGYETALGLARTGASVAFTTRDPEKGETTRKKLTAQSGNPRIASFECRLDDLGSVRDFCQRFKEVHPGLDVLINNAGVFETRRKVSANGFELTFAVNHLAPFLLTLQLIPLLKKSASARIINVTSKVYAAAQIHFEDPGFKQQFPFMAAYSQSKLANLLFTRYLAEQLNGSGITVNCVHPGVVMTSIYRNMHPLLRLFFNFYMIRPKQGAKPSLYLATSPEVEGTTGAYFHRFKKQEIRGAGLDMEAARRLWEMSMTYVSPWLPGNPI